VHVKDRVTGGVGDDLVAVAEGEQRVRVALGPLPFGVVSALKRRDVSHDPLDAVPGLQQFAVLRRISGARPGGIWSGAANRGGDHEQTAAPASHRDVVHPDRAGAVWSGDGQQALLELTEYDDGLRPWWRGAAVSAGNAGGRSWKCGSSPHGRSRCSKPDTPSTSRKVGRDNVVITLGAPPSSTRE
jgi:hypothetical protein